ncbi:MAG TPA: pyridoxamine 5'-phosphate oxidase family protein [Candidatus Binataceae bacterium]|nr:pyridoxamine 5'-phosphate oxidase family protein [Candidatus Binataceae bacterium]
MNDYQKSKLATLCAREHVAAIVTIGEDWPTVTMQAFAETSELDLIFIMPADSDKFQNLSRRPNAAILIDDRDTGDVRKLAVSRASIQGIANEVAQNSPQWDRLKAIFLDKNPFEAPFFAPKYVGRLRMVRIRPSRVSYAGPVGGPPEDTFKVEL